MALFSAFRNAPVQGMRSKPQSGNGFARSALMLALLLAVAAILTSCASSNIGDRMPAAVGGCPGAHLDRKRQPSIYTRPAAPASETVLTGEQQKQVEDELGAARTRPATAAGSIGSTGKATGNARNP